MFYRFIRGLVSIFMHIFFRIKVYGLDKVPSEGPLIVCANHHSNWDPVFLSVVIRRQIRWMAKKELFKNSILGFLLNKLGVFPVDRESSDVSAIKNALRLLKNGEVLGLFPEGTRVDGFNPDNVKPGIALLNVKSKAVTLPVYIHGTFKIFSKLVVNIGNPVNYSEYENNKDYEFISKDILETIYKLKRVD